MAFHESADLETRSVRTMNPMVPQSNGTLNWLFGSNGRFLRRASTCGQLLFVALSPPGVGALELLDEAPDEPLLDDEEDDDDEEPLDEELATDSVAGFAVRPSAVYVVP